LLPEYDSGVYTSARTDMVVSRGIGNSVIPVRFNNRPEVILITLKSA
jgi:predicted MPP superfamily phosphohydrolase